MAAGAVSLRKSHDIVISSFCSIVKGQANYIPSSYIKIVQFWVGNKSYVFFKITQKSMYFIYLFSGISNCSKLEGPRNGWSNYVTTE